MSFGCFTNDDADERNTSDHSGDYSVCFTVVYAAVGLQYVLLCLVVVTCLARWWFVRRGKRRTRSTFNLSHGGETDVHTSGTPAAEKIGQIELQLQDSDAKRVSAAYSVVRYSSTLNNHQNSSDPSSKVIKGSQTELPTIYSKGLKRSQQPTLLEDSVCVQKQSEAPSTPKQHQQPLKPTPRVRSELLKDSDAPVIDHVKKTVDYITAPLIGTKTEPCNNQEDDDDHSSTYSMAGQCEEDGTNSSAHYSTISHDDDKSSDIYSLANSNNEEAADYEDFYSVPRDVDEADSSCEDTSTQGNDGLRANTSDKAQNMKLGESGLKQGLLQQQQQLQQCQPLAGRRKKSPVPLPEAHSRPRSVSNIVQPKQMKLTDPWPIHTSTSFRSGHNPYVNVK